METSSVLNPKPTSLFPSTPSINTTAATSSSSSRRLPANRTEGKKAWEKHFGGSDNDVGGVEGERRKRRRCDVEEQLVSRLANIICFEVEAFLLLLGGIFSSHLSGLCVCMMRLSITEICHLGSYCELTVKKKKKKKKTRMKTIYNWMRDYIKSSCRSVQHFYEQLQLGSLLNKKRPHGLLGSTKCLPVVPSPAWKINAQSVANFAEKLSQ